MGDDEAAADIGSGSRGGLGRRQLLGAAAAGAAGLADALAGCDSGSGPGSTPRPALSGSTGPITAADTHDWRIRSCGPRDAVEGYADQVSVLPGEEFGLYVSTTAPGFRVSAFRVGWYGGAQAALVWRSGRVAGHRQDRPHLVVPTRTVQAAGWQRSLSVPTDGWPEGAYLLRLDAENGHQRYVPLIVRSTSAAGRTLLMHAPATWQAYNKWGGYSLYTGRDGSRAPLARRQLRPAVRRQRRGEIPGVRTGCGRARGTARHPAGVHHGDRRTPRTGPAGGCACGRRARARRVLDAGAAAARHCGAGRGHEPGVPRGEHVLSPRPAGAGRRRHGRRREPGRRSCPAGPGCSPPARCGGSRG